MTYPLYRIQQLLPHRMEYIE